MQISIYMFGVCNSGKVSSPVFKVVYDQRDVEVEENPLQVCSTMNGSTDNVLYPLISLFCAFYSTPNFTKIPQHSKAACRKLRLLRCDWPNEADTYHAKKWVDGRITVVFSKGLTWLTLKVKFCRLQTAASWLDKAVPALCNRPRYVGPTQCKIPANQPQSRTLNTATPCWPVLWSQCPNRSRCPSVLVTVYGCLASSPRWLDTCTVCRVQWIWEWWGPRKPGF